VTNPVARESVVNYFVGNGEESQPAYRQVMTYCPACEQAHAFTVEVFDRHDGKGKYTHRADGSPQPVWQWDGNLERPTFSPSMLAYYTVHLCPPDYVHSEVCKDYGTDACTHIGHGIEWLNPDGSLRRVSIDDDRDNPPEGVTEVYTSGLPHVADPAYGNCHSFLKDGQWQFLSDCAHAMAGQTVDMVPLPNYLNHGEGS
jgi:hypothetical protein